VRWGRADLMRELLGKMCAREDLSAAVAVAATTAAAAGGLRMPSPARPACCGRGGGGGCPVCIAVRPRAETCRHRRSAPVSSSLSQPGQLTGPVHLCQCERRHRGSARHLGVPHDTAQLPRERPLELSRRPMPDVRGGRASISFVECMHKLAMAPYPVARGRTCGPLLGSLEPSYEDAWVVRVWQVGSWDVFVWRRRGGRVGSHVSAFQPAHSITGGVEWTLFGF